MPRSSTPGWVLVNPKTSPGTQRPSPPRAVRSRKAGNGGRGPAGEAPPRRLGRHPPQPGTLTPVPAQGNRGSPPTRAARPAVWRNERGGRVPGCAVVTTRKQRLPGNSGSPRPAGALGACPHFHTTGGRLSGRLAVHSLWWHPFGLSRLETPSSRRLHWPLRGRCFHLFPLPPAGCPTV